MVCPREYIGAVRGAYRHCGDVFHLRVDFIRQLHAKLAQHIGDGLVGEFDRLITGTVKADHQL